MFRSVCIALALATASLASSAQGSSPPALDISGIETITGLKGSYNKAEDVVKVSKPRNDVPVRVDRWALAPYMGVTSWAAFQPTPHGTMLMGDTVVFEDEVNPALSAALEAGLDVTALHSRSGNDGRGGRRLGPGRRTPASAWSLS